MEKKVDKRGDVKINRESQVRPFGLRDKLGYMFGDFGNDFSFIFAGSYLMVFYTKVLGFSGTIVGLLFLFSRVVDAFTDVTMGRIVDSVKPAKDGRFRPWIRRMCLPVVISSSLMYLYFVKDWPYGFKLTYAIVTYIVWSCFCYTAINIPYGSMASAISPNATDRAALSTFRSVGASLAGLVIGVVAPLIIFDTDAQGNQVVIPANMTFTTLVLGVLALICFVLCYRLCMERVVFEKQEKKSVGLQEMLQGVAQNRALIALVAAALLLLLASILGQTMNNYLFLDYFKNAKSLSIVNVIGVVGVLLLAPFSTTIARKVGKKEAGAVGMLLAGITYLALYFLRVRSVAAFIALYFLGTIGVGLFNLVVWAFITDVIDYQEVKTGRREDGTIYAVYSFARKVGQALAGGLGGFVLTAIGYISEATSQTEVVSERIYTVSTLIPGICFLLVFVIMQFFYPLSRGAVEENASILREKRK